MHPRRYLAAACLLGISTLAASAIADDGTYATALFNQGLAHMDAGRYEMGCPAILESYRLDPRPGTLFTLAECEAKRGRIATAVARYDEYLALFARLPPDKRAKQGDRETIAQTQRAALEPEVPKLTLILPPSAPKGTVVKRDGAVLTGDALGAAISVDPGEVILSTQAPGGPVTELRITLGKGEKKQAALEVRAPETRSPATPAITKAPPPEPRGELAGPIVVPILGGAAAAVGIGLGVAFTVISNGSASDADGFKTGNTSSCKSPATALDTERCESLKSSLEKSDTFSNLAVGSFVAGGVLAVGTAAYVLFAPRGALSTTRTGRAGATAPVIVSAAPVVGTNGAGLLLKGMW